MVIIVILKRYRFGTKIIPSLNMINQFFFVCAAVSAAWMFIAFRVNFLNVRITMKPKQLSQIIIKSNGDCMIRSSRLCTLRTNYLWKYRKTYYKGLQLLMLSVSVDRVEFYWLLDKNLYVFPELVHNCTKFHCPFYVVGNKDLKNCYQNINWLVPIMIELSFQLVT